MSQKREMKVQCPLCKGRLEIDADTGAIVHAEPAKSSALDLDAALGDVAGASDRLNEDFERAFESEKSRRDILAKKFERARRGIDDEGGEEKPEEDES